MSPLLRALIALLGGGMTVGGIALAVAAAGPVLDLGLALLGTLFALVGLPLGGWGFLTLLLSDGGPSGSASVRTRARRREACRRREFE